MANKKSDDVFPPGIDPHAPGPVGPDQGTQPPVHPLPEPNEPEVDPHAPGPVGPDQGTQPPVK